MESIFFAALTPGMARIAEQAMHELHLSFPIQVVSLIKDQRQSGLILRRMS